MIYGKGEVLYNVYRNIFNLKTIQEGIVLAGYLRIDEEIRKELGDGEEALWHDQPNPNKLFTPIDIFLVPFSFLWAGMAAFGFFSTFRDGIFFPFSLFTGAFFLAGIYITIGRFVFKYLRKKERYIY